MSIIGQKQVLSQIESWFENGTLPRFIIISGIQGSGKTLVYEEIAKNFTNSAYVENKVDGIRNLIQLIYRLSEPTIYCVEKAEKLSGAAENSLLKITEEVPRNAVIVLCVEDEASLLPTIRSRGTILRLQPYSKQEISDYVNSLQLNYSQDIVDIFSEICYTPGQVNQLLKTDVLEMYEYAIKVVRNIGKSSGANAFKIASSLKLKEDAEGFEPIFFMRAVISYATRLAREGFQLASCAETVTTTSRHMSELKKDGGHKLSIIDDWILSLRKIWREVA